MLQINKPYSIENRWSGNKILSELTQEKILF